MSQLESGGAKLLNYWFIFENATISYLHSFLHGWGKICVEAWKVQPVISACVCDGEPVGVSRYRDSNLLPTLSCLQYDTVGLSHLHTLNINGASVVD